MCKPRDAHLDEQVLELRRSLKRQFHFWNKADILFWACIFAVLLAAVAAYEATHDLREVGTAPATIIGCSAAKFEKLPGALSPGQTVYHVTGCPGTEYWLVRSVAQK